VLMAQKKFDQTYIPKKVIKRKGRHKKSLNKRDKPKGFFG